MIFYSRITEMLQRIRRYASRAWVWHDNQWTERVIDTIVDSDILEHADAVEVEHFQGMSIISTDSLLKPSVSLETAKEVVHRFRTKIYVPYYYYRCFRDVDIRMSLVDKLEFFAVENIPLGAEQVLYLAMLGRLPWSRFIPGDSSARDPLMQLFIRDVCRNKNGDLRVNMVELCNRFKKDVFLLTYICIALDQKTSIDSVMNIIYQVFGPGEHQFHTLEIMDELALLALQSRPRMWDASGWVYGEHCVYWLNYINRVDAQTMISKKQILFSDLLLSLLTNGWHVTLEQVQDEDARHIISQWSAEMHPLQLERKAIQAAVQQWLPAELEKLTGEFVHLRHN